MLGVHFFEPLCTCEDKMRIKKVFHFWPSEIAASVHGRYGPHWARIQKKVQKPPQSTHQIPGFFLSKNPERVDCGGIFNSKFFKSDQKSTEIQ